MTRSSEAISYIVKNQGEQTTKESLGDYLNILSDKISNAPETGRSFSSTLNYDKSENYHLKALLNQINNLLVDTVSHTKIVSLIDKHPDLGFLVVKGLLNLLPTNPNKLPVDPAILIHRGHMLIETPRGRYNNYDNLSQGGIFGSPDFGVPTYLQPYGTRLVSPQVDKQAKKAESICLYVDAEKLVEYRSLYPDPEGLIITPELGNSFFILGGIPAVTIMAIAKSPHDPVMVIPR